MSQILTFKFSKLDWYVSCTLRTCQEPVVTWKGPGRARSLSAGQWTCSLICYQFSTGRQIDSWPCQVPFMFKRTFPRNLFRSKFDYFLIISNRKFIFQSNKTDKSYSFLYICDCCTKLDGFANLLLEITVVLVCIRLWECYPPKSGQHNSSTSVRPNVRMLSPKIGAA